MADPTVDAGGGVVGDVTGGLGGVVGTIGDILDGGIGGADSGSIIDISQDAGIVITLPILDAGPIVIPPITVPGCAQDSDCGGSLSGVICGVAALCVPGCDATNGCALGLSCTADTGGICLVPTGTVTPPIVIEPPTDPTSDSDAGAPPVTTPVAPAGCTADSACGSLVSGLVCDVVTGSCLAGCHVDASTGNGCPAGLACDPSFDLFGRCVTPAPTSSSSSTSSSSGSTSSTSSSGGSSTSSSGGSSSSSSSSGGGGTTGSDPTTRTPLGGSSSTTTADAGTGTDGADASSSGGGCNMSGTDSPSSRLGFVGLVLGVGLVLRGRRKST